MQAGDIELTFGPPAGDRRTLSKATLETLDALYRHPLAHNLEWRDVISLFTKLGSVEHKSDNEVALKVGGEHHLVCKPHTKDLAAADIMDLRHLLTRNGWSPHMAPAAITGAPELAKRAEDLLIVVEYHEARLYRLDVWSANPADDVIRPHDPHRFAHHLAHKDQPGERGQRATEDPSFYKRIAAAIEPAVRLVIIGHGKGQSNAADQLIAYLKLHHQATYRKIARELVADLSSVTPPELLVLARRALSA